MAHLKENTSGCSLLMEFLKLEKKQPFENTVQSNNFFKHSAMERNIFLKNGLAYIEVVNINFKSP